MSQRIIRGVDALIEEAEEQIETISVRRGMELAGHPDVVFVDLREPRELDCEGRMPGAVHCPRGVMEFSIDPASPSHNPIFAQDRRFVFFCAGGLRSALAAQVAAKMGLNPVCHMAGGFGAWKRAGGDVDRPALPPGVAPCPPLDAGQEIAA
ncbi:MAG: rhodanese-like domain-containing protein [Beijerinckiaceae bacterium]